MRRILWLLAVGPALAAGSVPAEGITGEVFPVAVNFVHYTQGTVSLGGKELPELRPGVTVNGFPEWKSGEPLRTGLGLAEVMLAAGVVVRLAEHTEVRREAGPKDQTALDLVSGALTVEILTPKPAPVVILRPGSRMELKAAGWYRIGTKPAELRVYEGAVESSTGAARKTVGPAEVLALEPGAIPRRMEPGADALVRWSVRRSQILATVNAASAQSILLSGMPYKSANWWWNPAFGSVTYVPARHSGCGWPGVCYYSPAAIAKKKAAQPVPVVHRTDGAGGTARS